MADLKEKILTSKGEIVPDIIFINAGIINVFTGELEIGDIAVKGDTIVGIGKYNIKNLAEDLTELNTDELKQETSSKIAVKPEIIDCKGKFISPGFIDGHIHIESSMLTPKEFAKVIIQHGTTSVITDPHEIVNVAGKAGLNYMLKESENLSVDIYVMLPSCVPATELDESGAVMGVCELKEFIEHKRVLGLAEVMDFHGIMKGEKHLLDKINLAIVHNKIVDGHAPGLKGKEVNAYVTAGITSDHECSTAMEAIEKLRRGLWIMIREGTAARNMEALKPLLKTPYCHRCMLVTDDKHPGDLLYEGHMDALIKKAIKLGANPLTAITMATLNPATYFGLKNRGAVAPGYKADLVILKDLVSFKIETVYKDGQIAYQTGKEGTDSEGIAGSEGLEENIGTIAESDITDKVINRINHISNENMQVNAAKSIEENFYEGSYEKSEENEEENIEKNTGNRPEAIFKSFHMPVLQPEDFYFKESGSYMRVMELVSGELLTKEAIYPVNENIDSRVMSKEFIKEDIIKLAVVERHHSTGLIGLGLLKGYGLFEGAVASSVSHDSHNLMVAGCNEEDMAEAANHVAKMQGGLCIVRQKQIMCELPLPVGGLMSEESAAYVDELLKNLKVTAKSIGISEKIDPFMTLAFLSLSVIPELRLTAKGVLNVRMGQFVKTFFDKNNI